MVTKDTLRVSSPRHDPEALTRMLMPEHGLGRAQGLPDQVSVPAGVEPGIGQVRLGVVGPVSGRGRGDPHPCCRGSSQNIPSAEATRPPSKSGVAGPA